MAADAPSVREAIELGVVGLLWPLVRKQGGYLHDCRPGGYETRGDNPDQVKHDIGGFPAILVETAAGTIQTRGMAHARSREQIRVVVWLCSANLRGPKEQRHGGPGGGDPGVYRMCDDVYKRLMGKCPDLGGQMLGLDELLAVASTPLASLKDLTLWKVEYSIHADLEAAIPAAEKLGSMTSRGRLPEDEDPSKTDRVVATTTTP